MKDKKIEFDGKEFHEIKDIEICPGCEGRLIPWFFLKIEMRICNNPFCKFYKIMRLK